MATITITITDLADFRVQVATDADKPLPGRGLTPAESLALDVLTLALRSRATVLYDAHQIPLVSFALDVISPEGYGWIVPQEVRTRAKRALGPRMGQLVPQPVGDGVDIDRVHQLRAEQAQR